MNIFAAVTLINSADGMKHPCLIITGIFGLLVSKLFLAKHSVLSLTASEYLVIMQLPKSCAV